ncbi:MAG: Mur ligase family protein [Actinomycetota bacterium]
MDYRSALAYLDRHTNLEGNRSDRFTPATPEVVMPVAGETAHLSLEPMEALLSAVGDPHRAYKVIHLTGTNGKGSTARYIAALLQATDLSVGLYTSPNIERINERLAWGGASISDADFARVIGLLASVEPLLDVVPSRFELLTAAAFIWFAELGVDVAVVEVGLLGRFDATNVVDSEVAVITNVGKDHTDGLDDWRLTVATEKAGIIKPSSHLVVGPDLEEFLPVFEAEGPTGVWVAGRDYELEANQLAVGGRVLDVRTPGASYDEVFLPFHGHHQGENLALAIAAVEAFFDRPLDQDLVEFALTTVELPVRFEVVAREPTLILDGAHNPPGAEATAATLSETFARMGSWVLVIGLLQGKDPVEMLTAFRAQDFDAVICCEPDWSRALPASEIAAAATSIGCSVEVVIKPVEALHRALAVAADEDLILVSGTHSILGDIRPLTRTLDD